MAENCASLTDSYLLQLLGKIDLKGAESLFDMGCGPGTVSLALAKKMPIIYGVDYSRGMLSVAAPPRCANERPSRAVGAAGLGGTLG